MCTQCIALSSKLYMCKRVHARTELVHKLTKANTQQSQNNDSAETQCVHVTISFVAMAIELCVCIFISVEDFK